jgi:hypothetical protein
VINLRFSIRSGLQTSAISRSNGPATLTSAALFWMILPVLRSV